MSLLAKSVRYSELARAFHRDGAEYSFVLGGTGCCPDGELSYRTAMPSGVILADLAGFYQAFGFPLPQGGDRKPDHISSELEFVSFLYAKEAYAEYTKNGEGVEIVRDARAAFLRDHVATWIAAFARTLEERAPDTKYAVAARDAAALVAGEVPLGEIRPPADDAEPVQCQEESR